VKRLVTPGAEVAVDVGLDEAEAVDVPVAVAVAVEVDGGAVSMDSWGPVPLLSRLPSVFVVVLDVVRPKV
jgi:hypothetical protein